MSQPIQAYDIHHNAIYEEIEKISPTTAKLASDEIAKIANLLIKFGFVSPPVYVIRDMEDDKLFHEIVSGEIFMTANPKQAQMEGVVVYEHWKGQME